MAAAAPASEPGPAGRASLTRQAAWFLATCLGLLAITLPAGWWSRGTDGLVAAGTAVGVCGLAGLAALVGGALWFSRPDQVWQQLGLGLGLRMTIPLAVGLAVLKGVPRLERAGFAYYLLAAYLVTLGVDTWLTVAARRELDQPQPPASERPANAKHSISN